MVRPQLLYLGSGVHHGTLGRSQVFTGAWLRRGLGGREAGTQTRGHNILLSLSHYSSGEPTEATTS